jgi:hypothetical protein
MSVSKNMMFLSVLAGFLDRLAFHKAMDLISIAQQGKEITRWVTLPAWHLGTIQNSIV